jgi:dipeptidyl aminopeptidase/acylaminoacyl peptidase
VRPRPLLLVVLALALPLAMLVPPASSQTRGVDGWLYYVVTGDATAGELWRVRPGQPGTAAQLTVGHEDDRPSVSPDGRTVAFRRIDPTATNGEPSHQLWLMDADGTNERRVDLADLDSPTPAWSPDGRRLALTASPGTVLNLWTATRAGTRLRPVLDWDVAADFRPTAPTFTPDGRWIVFVGDRPGTDVRDVMSVRPDGTGLQPLTSDDLLEDSPDVSPDGRRLAYVARDPETFQRTVRIVAMDGSGPRTVPGLDDPVRVRWTPDGSHLVVTQGTPRRITLVVPSTGATTPASPGAADVQERDGVVGPTPTQCDGRWATIVGSAAGETIRGSVGHDVIVAGGGRDTVLGLEGDDVICGGPGDDDVTGGPGVDRLFGQSGSDTLRARDSRRDGRIDCGADRDPAAGRDAGVDPAAVSCNP